MKFSLRFTKILSTTILAILIGSVVFPAGVAFAQTAALATSSGAQTSIPAIPEVPKTDPYYPFKTLFDVPLTSTDGKVVSGVNLVTVGSIFDTNAVKSLKVESGLVLSEQKNRWTSAGNKFNDFFVDMTADTAKVGDVYADGFVLLTSYTDANGKPQEKVTPVPYNNSGERTAGENTTFFMKTAKDDLTLWKQQNVYTQVNLDTPLAYGSRADTTLWYCAGNKNKVYKNLGNLLWFGPAIGSLIPESDSYMWTVFEAGGYKTDGENTIVDGNKVRTFKNSSGAPLCEGTSYIRIGQGMSVTFSDYKSASTPVEAGTDKGSISNESGLPTCGLAVIGGKGTFMGCIALIVYHLFFRLAAFFAYLTGNIFDFFLGFSISSDAYSSSFVTAGWETVRDIANIFFIVLLIYVAIGSVFNINGVSKKLVGAIIINAILINFSLLITRGLIDISNIAARVFYSQIQVQNKSVETNTIVSGGNAEDVQYVGDSGYKSVSTIMLQSFDPQVVFDRAVMQQPATVNDADKTSGSANFASNQKNLSSIRITNPEEYAGYFALVTLICAFIAFTTGMIFWSIGFIFIGRVVGLYISMIFSPFAFMSRDIPFLKVMDKWHFSAWMSDLTKYLISAPITVIYFYVVIQIMQSDFYSSKISTNATAATSFTATVLWITIPLIIIYGLLSKGKDMINSFAGETGKLVGDLVKKGVGIAGGAALGVATGGAAFLGTRAGAAAGRGIANSTIGKWALRNQDNDGWLQRNLARTTLKGVNKSQTASFDLRNNKTFTSATGSLFGQMGIAQDVSKYSDVGKDANKGGYEGRMKREEESNKKKISDIEVNKTAFSEDSIKEAWKEKTRNEFLKTYVADKTKTEAEQKTAFEAAFSDHEKEQEKKYGKVKDQKSFEIATRMKYAEKMENGDFENDPQKKFLNAAGVLGGAVLTGNVAGVASGLIGGYGTAGVIIGAAGYGGSTVDIKKDARTKAAKDAIKDLEKKIKSNAKQKRSDDYAEELENQLANEFAEIEENFNKVRDVRNQIVVDSIKTGTDTKLKEELDKLKDDKEKIHKLLEANFTKDKIKEIVDPYIEVAQEKSQTEIAALSQKRKDLEASIGAYSGASAEEKRRVQAQIKNVEREIVKAESEIQNNLLVSYEKLNKEKRLKNEAWNKAQDKVSKIETRKEKEKESSKPKDASKDGKK